MSGVSKAIAVVLLIVILLSACITAIFEAIVEWIEDVIGKFVDWVSDGETWRIMKNALFFWQYTPPDGFDKNVIFYQVDKYQLH